MGAIPFVEPLEQFAYGRVDQLSPLVARVVAENPSKFTYKGTGTYIVGHRDVVVIDPGPAIDSHRKALENALLGRVVRGIVVTHCHTDHVPLAGWLARTTKAPTFGYGPHPRHPEISAYADDSSDSGEVDGASEDEREHVDYDFHPDVKVADGEVFWSFDGWSLRGIHTPGHTSNHLCIHLDAENALFTGDHIMGWSTTVVSPPDGNMKDYIKSVEKLLSRSDSILYPTHGNPIRNPREFLVAYLAHRVEREEQILDLLAISSMKIAEIVETLYADVRPELHKAASRSVLAHLLKLHEETRVAIVDGTQPSMSSLWSRSKA